jgi:hypothetical protein
MGHMLEKSPPRTQVTTPTIALQTSGEPSASSARQDLLKAIIFALLIYPWEFDITEKLAVFTSKYGSMQLDELPIALLMVAMAGA